MREETAGEAAEATAADEVARVEEAARVTEEATRVTEEAARVAVEAAAAKVVRAAFYGCILWLLAWGETDLRVRIVRHMEGHVRICYFSSISSSFWVYSTIYTIIWEILVISAISTIYPVISGVSTTYSLQQVNSDPLVQSLPSFGQP